MDDSPAEYGAPVYLRRSHLNRHVGKDEVFVNLDEVRWSFLTRITISA